MNNLNVHITIFERFGSESIFRHYSNLQHEPVYEFQFLEMIFAFVVYSEPWRDGESAVITGSMATLADKQSFP